jgi:hypothetical protein
MKSTTASTTETEIKIEKNIPYVESIGKGRGRKAKYPFPKMKPGNSITVKGTTVGNMLSGANNWKHRSGNLSYKFKAKEIDAKGKVVRLWRLS